MEKIVSQEAAIESCPVRGSLRLSITTSSPQVTAGTDFSIFVLIQNPFDVPITIYQVQTHIPIELVDVNGRRLDRAQREKEKSEHTALRRIWDSIKYRIDERRRHSGIAIAVGTDFNPEAEREFVRMSTEIKSMGDNSSVVGLQLKFPVNPSSEELDKIFRRIVDYKQGIIPVTLHPGDSIVKQFVLCTRNWLFFTPLTHMFQIQVNYSSDGVDHADTISYQQSIRSTMGAMALGAITGAAMGTLLKNLTGSSPSTSGASLSRVLAASILASLAVIIAFARKSTAQPIISVEDFWGGALIGFSTGFFGFEQFFGLFSSKTS